jgi:hypothetical protein
VVEEPGETDCEPEVALLPLHPPLAVHDVAPDEDHVSVEDWPAFMLVGEAENVVETGGGV